MDRVQLQSEINAARRRRRNRLRIRRLLLVLALLLAVYAGKRPSDWEHRPILVKCEALNALGADQQHRPLCFSDKPEICPPPEKAKRTKPPNAHGPIKPNNRPWCEWWHTCQKSA